MSLFCLLLFALALFQNQGQANSQLLDEQFERNAESTQTFTTDWIEFHIPTDLEAKINTEGKYPFVVVKAIPFTETHGNIRIEAEPVESYEWGISQDIYNSISYPYRDIIELQTGFYEDNAGLSRMSEEFISIDGNPAVKVSYVVSDVGFGAEDISAQYNVFVVTENDGYIYEISFTAPVSNYNALLSGWRTILETLQFI